MDRGKLLLMVSRSGQYGAQIPVPVFPPASDRHSARLQGSGGHRSRELDSGQARPGDSSEVKNSRQNSCLGSQGVAGRDGMRRVNRHT
jgi:hypothetical protein